MVLKAINNPSKILPAIRSYFSMWVTRRVTQWVRQSRLAFNWILADSPRVYYIWAYIAGANHPSFKTYVTHPPVRYTLYSLADICHFFDSVPDWNEKPFVVEFEHVLALGGNVCDWQHGLRRIKYIEDIIASDRCRVALTLSKGLISHSTRYISDPSLHEKFDYLYPCYPTQKPRFMDLSRPFTILTIASRFYDKGVPIALKAFEVLRERYGSQVQMILVCDCLPTGYPIPDGVTIHTVRPLSNTLKAKLYSNAHVLFLPVLTETLGCFPEAYAYGTPVVTTRIHHGDEAVREGVTGFLVDPPFYSYSDGFGTRWKIFEEFLTDCKQSYERGIFNDLINQCVDRLDRMVSGDVDLRKMSAAAQTFHREIFSTEVRNERLRQIYRRVAGV
jgi:glycosyltransferase involved in cell wall biosynthesis